MITTGSKESTIGVANRFESSTNNTPRLDINQAAAGIIARLRIRIPSGNNLACSSRIKNPIASRSPIKVVAERICKSLTSGVKNPKMPPALWT